MTSWSTVEPAADIGGRPGGLIGRLAARALAVPTWVLLAGLVAVSALVRFRLSLTSGAPWIIPDELVYSELARSFASGGHFIVRDVEFSAWTYGPLYPILIAPAYALGATVADAYVIAKAINCVLMSAAAVPAYLLARRVLRRENALLVALFAILVPSGIYTTKIMTESVSYPVFLLAMLGIVRALEEPSRRRELAALALAGLAVLARAEMVVLFPAFLTAIVVLAAIESRQAAGPRTRFFSRLSLFRTTWVVTAGGALAAVAFLLIRSPAELGAHVDLLGRVRPGHAASKLVYHVADLDLYSGVIPFAAFGLVVVSALRSGVSRPLRVFAVSAASASVWLFAVAAVYSTAFRHVYDRYVFYLVPLFVVALLVWIEQGLPRPRRATTVAAAVACLLPLTLPLSMLINGREWGTSSSTVALLPWAVVGAFVGHGFVLKAIMLVFCGALAVAFLRSGPERAQALVRIVAWNALAISALAFILSAHVAKTATGYGVGASPSWIDAAAGADAKVVAIWPGYAEGGQQGAYAVWESEFFNRSVRSVYNLREPLPDGMTSAQVRIRNGWLVHERKPVRAQYVLAGASLNVAGKPVATDARSGMVLYRVAGPVRLVPLPASARRRG